MMLKGERLDKPTYAVLQSSIGSGSHGEVVLVEHGIFGHLQVQKTVSLLGVTDSVARSEPARLKSFKHDNIIEISEAQWTPKVEEILKCVTFVSPYYEGRCIHSALIDGYEFGVAGTLAIAGGILSAFVYLHDEHGLLHRDIKPANVMLDVTRTHAYVGDPGSAAEMDPTAKTTDYYGGTPLYRPPEAAADVLDVRSDLFGVGAVMVEMLNGPHDYEHIDRDKVDKRIAEGRRALPDAAYALAPWVPPQVSAVVRRLAAADPEKRYPSAHHARRAVNDIQCVTWARVDGSDLTGVWQGTFPPHLPQSNTRVYKVSAEPIVTGKYAGKVKVSARWRRQDDLNWHGYASLGDRIDADDPKALGDFFRAVEAKAHSAPTA